tara:strand:+ start:147 stop:356 length:210 start_codon:yes stop_codon:yes gene_type:complete
LEEVQHLHQQVLLHLEIKEAVLHLQVLHPRVVDLVEEINQQVTVVMVVQVVEVMEVLDLKEEVQVTIRL